MNKSPNPLPYSDAGSIGIQNDPPFLLCAQFDFFYRALGDSRRLVVDDGAVLHSTRSNRDRTHSAMIH